MAKPSSTAEEILKDHPDLLAAWDAQSAADTCDTCKWWELFPEDALWGRCSLISCSAKECRDNAALPIASRDDDGDRILLTPFSFGCNQHEAKG